MINSMRRNTRRVECFASCYIIEDHFDAILNHIDICTEQALAKTIDQQNITELNQHRAILIAQIRIVNELNQRQNTQTQEDFEKTWRKIIDSNIDYESKLECIKKDLIKTDCVVLVDPRAMIGCALWVLNCYSSTKKEIDLLECVFIDYMFYRNALMFTYLRFSKLFIP